MSRDPVKIQNKSHFFLLRFLLRSLLRLRCLLRPLFGALIIFFTLVARPASAPTPLNTKDPETPAEKMLWIFTHPLAPFRGTLGLLEIDTIYETQRTSYLELPSWEGKMQVAIAESGGPGQTLRSILQEGVEFHHRFLEIEKQLTPHNSIHALRDPWGELLRMIYSDLNPPSSNQPKQRSHQEAEFLAQQDTSTRFPITNDKTTPSSAQDPNVKNYYFHRLNLYLNEETTRQKKQFNQPLSYYIKKYRKLISEHLSVNYLILQKGITTLFPLKQGLDEPSSPFDFFHHYEMKEIILNKKQIINPTSNQQKTHEPEKKLITYALSEDNLPRHFLFPLKDTQLIIERKKDKSITTLNMDVFLNIIRVEIYNNMDFYKLGPKHEHLVFLLDICERAAQLNEINSMIGAYEKSLSTRKSTISSHITFVEKDLTDLYKKIHDRYLFLKKSMRSITSDLAVHKDPLIGKSTYEGNPFVALKWWGYRRFHQYWWVKENLALLFYRPFIDFGDTNFSQQAAYAFTEKGLQEQRKYAEDAYFREIVLLIYDAEIQSILQNMSTSSSFWVRTFKNQMTLIYRLQSSNKETIAWIQRKYFQLLHRKTPRFLALAALLYIATPDGLTTGMINFQFKTWFSSLNLGSSNFQTENQSSYNLFSLEEHDYIVPQKKGDGESTEKTLFKIILKNNIQSQSLPTQFYGVSIKQVKDHDSDKISPHWVHSLSQNSHNDRQSREYVFTLESQTKIKVAQGKIPLYSVKGFLLNGVEIIDQNDRILTLGKDYVIKYLPRLGLYYVQFITQNTSEVHSLKMGYSSIGPFNETNKEQDRMLEMPMDPNWIKEIISQSKSIGLTAFSNSLSLSLADTQSPLTIQDFATDWSKSAYYTYQNRNKNDLFTTIENFWNSNSHISWAPPGSSISDGSYIGQCSGGNWTLSQMLQNYFKSTHSETGYDSTILNGYKRDPTKYVLTLEMGHRTTLIYKTTGAPGWAHLDGTPMKTLPEESNNASIRKNKDKKSDTSWNIRLWLTPSTKDSFTPSPPHPTPPRPSEQTDFTAESRRRDIINPAENPASKEPLPQNDPTKNKEEMTTSNSKYKTQINGNSKNSSAKDIETQRRNQLLNELQQHRKPYLDLIQSIGIRDGTEFSKSPLAIVLIASSRIIQYLHAYINEADLRKDLSQLLGGHPSDTISQMFRTHLDAINKYRSVLAQQRTKESGSNIPGRSLLENPHLEQAHSILLNYLSNTPWISSVELPSPFQPIKMDFHPREFAPKIACTHLL